MPNKPAAAELGPQVAREFIAAVDFLGPRRNALAGETPHLGADLVELGPQPEVEIASVE